MVIKASGVEGDQRGWKGDICNISTIKVQILKIKHERSKAEVEREQQGWEEQSPEDLDERQGIDYQAIGKTRITALFIIEYFRESI